MIRNVTPLPVPPESPDPARNAVCGELGIADDAFIVMTAGRFVPLKQFDTLLRGFAALRGTIGNAVAIVAGEGPLRGELETLAVDLGIADAVRFPGWKRDLLPLITACDCAVSCSETECSPVFLIEAMSLGRPVIAAAAEDVAGLIQHDVSGLLFPMGDHGAMCDAMTSVARDPAMAQRMGATAREHVQRLFDRDESVREMSALYERVAGCDVRSGGGRPKENHL